ncbi:hypothetical protein HNQ50_003705, partial [Silvimonas terrae]|nr:hypothetical protein [Silvimonas terrae]MBB5192951.1 hypothetical protein [Silvimonas terrae]
MTKQFSTFIKSFAAVAGLMAVSAVASAAEGANPYGIDAL